MQVNTVDCVCFVTQKAAFEKMRNLDTKEMVFDMKIMDLNTEVSAKKIIVTLIFEIDSSGINMAMTLINQKIMVLFHII